MFILMNALRKSVYFFELVFIRYGFVK